MGLLRRFIVWSLLERKKDENTSLVESPRSEQVGRNTCMTDTRIKILSVLILVGAFPLSVGRIFHSSWLSWTGVAFVGIACLWFVIDFLREILPELWRWLREPKGRRVQTESRIIADEYLRLGWTLTRKFDGSSHGEATFYLLEWLGDGDPVRIDLRKISLRKADA